MRITKFDDMCETGKWLLLRLIGYVPREVAWLGNCRAPVIEIAINDHLVADPDVFFDEVGKSIDNEIARQASQRALAEVSDILGRLNDVVYSVKQELTQQIVKQFGISLRDLTEDG